MGIFFNYILGVLGLFFFLTPFSWLHAQQVKLKQKDVPTAVRTAFAMKYHHAKKIRWMRNDSLYQVSFYSHDYLMRASYDTLGNWKEHAIRIQMKEAPHQVFMSWFQGFYGDWMPRRIEKVETPHAQPVYLLEVHLDDMIREIIYDERGTLLKQIIIKQ